MYYINIVIYCQICVGLLLFYDTDDEIILEKKIFFCIIVCARFNFLYLN